MSLDENGVADSCVDYDRNDDENARGLPGGDGRFWNWLVHNHGHKSIARLEQRPKSIVPT